MVDNYWTIARDCWWAWTTNFYEPLPLVTLVDIMLVDKHKSQLMMFDRVTVPCPCPCHIPHCQNSPRPPHLTAGRCWRLSPQRSEIAKKLQDPDLMMVHYQSMIQHAPSRININTLFELNQPIDQKHHWGTLSIDRFKFQGLIDSTIIHYYQ